uniref:Tetratricopeptide repeat-containing protein n=1 Tax=Candidatus Kentrum sp. DK TaxID=2126562 RepID=A0A450RTW4_9GAMM|nr:MAG: Tetratricopeptide repeat-containing protein [Candidatus Kentron sp. DK]
MTGAELILHFSGDTAGNTAVNVSFAGTDSGQLPFINPITDRDRSDIRWYVETYGAHSLAEPDDEEARRIETRLPEIGAALFTAVFADRAAQRVFDRFQDTDDRQRVLTIDAQDAAILSLPWELLRDPAGPGAFLFRDRPRISVRRRITGATGGRAPFRVESKEQLHLLFVVSRPIDAGFIDPRTDPQAVLDALDQHAAGRVTWEFLHPATLDALAERLNDDSLPAVDILHFDGHGVFAQVSEEDAEEKSGLYGKSILSEIQRARAAHSGDTAQSGDADKPVGIGFLLFEKADGASHLIPAEDLADNLYRSRVALVVLSACQSAASATEGDPMASVAGRLTGTGIPAILAMTHSVLVATTEQLFGRFYQGLARGRGIATALDDARAHLANHPEKFEVRRGDGFEMLKLYDWFLPALFHGGADAPLLTADSSLLAAAPAAAVKKHNLRPAHEAGFFGRRRELHDIERWFAGPTRRISLTGFGGQGKTELALEAGRWLVRTGLFDRAVFVDYAQVQAEDACAVAVSTISTVLEESLIDAAAATVALRQTPTLVILDNLEAVSQAALGELLTAAADWSRAGDSRVLLTSRTPEFGHADYRVEGTLQHRRIALRGLGSTADPDDALDWFAALFRLPPDPSVPPPQREELIALFDRVGFHPLSIAVLAQQLKTRPAGELGGRLEAILRETALSTIADDGTPPSLMASLALSLERLDDADRHAARRLGVFQGGAMEDVLLAITGLGASDGERAQLQTLLAALERGDPHALLRAIGREISDGAEPSAEQLAELLGEPEREKAIEELRARLAALPAQGNPSGAAENRWPGLRRQLENAALLQIESIPGVSVPFLRFHPTLAPLLWAGITAEEQDQLTLAHRQRYYQLANYLYHEDAKNPHQARAIARRELPNILHACRNALEAGDSDAVDFVDSINRFLTVFGMGREAALLTRRAEAAGGERGSDAWFLAQSNRGEQLLATGRASEAAEIFADILAALGDQPSYNRATTLSFLGRCYLAAGHPDRAEAIYRQGIAVTEQLAPSAKNERDAVKRHGALLRTDLADVLAEQGQYAEARAQYEQSLEVKRELGGDLRGERVVLGQLGTLALREGDLAEAVGRYREALKLCQQMGEPAGEAIYQHQLGMAFQEARRWGPAEGHYREAARLRERHGDLAGAAQTWNNLAALNESAGRPEAAERWYRKAIDGMQNPPSGDRGAKCLNNLADLLQSQPGRLAEARALAEEALAINETLEPGAAAIWTTYNILAEIADRQSRPDEAADYRRLAREAKRRFAGTAHEMKQHLPVILGTLQAIGEPDTANAFSTALSRMEEHGWTNLVAAIRRILAGERDQETLCAPLDPEDSMIIETILRGIADPETLSPLLPPPETA